MATRIHFANQLKVDVKAEIAEAHSRVRDGDSWVDFENEQGRRVYVNRDRIAYLEEQPSRRGGFD